MAALQEVAPGLQAEVDAATGAVGFLTGALPVSLPQERQPVRARREAVARMVREHDALFRLDLEEYEVENCSRLGTAVNLRYGRKTREGVEVVGLRESFVAQVAIEKAELSAFFGNYLPTTVALPELEACLDGAGATESLPGNPIAFQTFAGCLSTGRGTYEVQADDPVRLERLALMLDPIDGEQPAVAVRLVWTGDVDVHADNVTQELRDSDANCGDAIGWTVLVDATTGELVRARPRCLVC